MRAWRSVSVEEAKAHPLYGIRGWLLLFAISHVFGLITIIGTVRVIAHDSGLTLSELFSIDDPIIYYLKFASVIQAAANMLIIYYIFNKSKGLRRNATIIMAAIYPVLILGYIIFESSHLFPETLFNLFANFLGSLIWICYLQRSERVRVTFEHKILEENGKPFKTDPAPKPSAPLIARPANDPEQIIEDESLWEKALAELEGQNRRPGLWAKCYAQSGGDEARAKASYLDARVKELRRSHLSGREINGPSVHEAKHDAQQSASADQERGPAKEKAISEILLDMKNSERSSGD